MWHWGGRQEWVHGYFFCRVHRFSQWQLCLPNFFDFTHGSSLKRLLDPEPDVILSGDDEQGAEYDEGEAQAVLDQEEVEVIVLGVGEEETDVIVRNVEANETGQKKERPKR